MENCKALSFDMQEMTQELSEIEAYIKDTDWPELLQDNKRLARKLLDAIKLHERPLVLLEAQELSQDINVGVRNIIMNFHKQQTSMKFSERTTAAKRFSHAVQLIGNNKL